MMTLITAWQWVVLGVTLLLLELITGSGFLLWIACSSFVVGVLLWLLPSITWPIQLLVFSIGTLVSCCLWWYYLRHYDKKSDSLKLNRRSEQYIGRNLTLETDIVNGRGKVKIGDSIWRVQGEALSKGTVVKVVGVDGVILIVESIGPQESFSNDQ